MYVCVYFELVSSLSFSSFLLKEQRLFINHSGFDDDDDDAFVFIYLFIYIFTFIYDRKTKQHVAIRLLKAEQCIKIIRNNYFKVIFFFCVNKKEKTKRKETGCCRWIHSASSSSFSS